MKIIILGAGQVGGSLAEHLADEEKNDVTVVDSNNDRLRELQDKLDIRTIHGKASVPHVLSQAGANDADMLVAVTNNDEVNMVACQIAFLLFQTPTKIARIRDSRYLAYRSIFQAPGIPIDVFISPAELVMNNLKKIIEYPGTLQVLDFAGGRLKLVVARTYYGGNMIGKELQVIQKDSNTKIHIVAIFRRGHAIQVNRNTVIESGDEVFFIADSNNIKSTVRELRHIDKVYKRVVIAGGGNIGLRLAQTLESKYNIKIIEENFERCQYLSQNLEKTIILNGSASDKDLLLAEAVDTADVYIALMNDDEDNIMSSLLAKKIGVRRVISLINNTAYVDLIQGGDIDIVISPQLITTSDLLRYVRRGDIVNVYSLRRGAAEVIEIIAHGDEKSSAVVGMNICDINLPRGTKIGAIVRQDHVILAHDNLEISSGDHVIIFMSDKKKIREVEKLFQVGISFF